MSDYSLKINTDGKVIDLKIRCDEHPTWRELIGLLRNLAAQLKEKHKNDESNVQ